MDARIFTEPQQGASYDDLLAVALAGEKAGFNAFFRSDHWLKMGDGDGLPGPTDSWVTLGGLARDTSTIRLGTLVTSATFRLPGVLATQVAQVDQMSGGRVELGLGAGWYEAEHTAYGIPFPPLGERFEVLNEQLEIITGLWGTPEGDNYDFAGKHFNLKDSPALPKPTQQKIPVVIGGGGKKKTPALAAKYASEFNLGMATVDRFTAQRDRVATACEAIDRDPDELTYSLWLVVACGKNDAEVARRAGHLGRSVENVTTEGLGGTPDQIIEKLNTYKAAGCDRIYFQFLDLSDLDQLALLGEEVLPHI
jgi:F420-dependent oxidoreductase-like protein